MPGRKRYFPTIYGPRCRRSVSTTLSNFRHRRWPQKVDAMPLTAVLPSEGQARRCSIASGPPVNRG